MTKKPSHYSILAFYRFTPIENPKREIKEQLKFCKELDIRGRTYISEQGINGQMSASPEAAKEYINWMAERAEFSSMPFKLHKWPYHTFEKLTIKYREKLVGFDQEVNFNNQGEHVSPKKWKEMLESDEEKVILDVRNQYEWEVGHFEGAENPNCRTFREYEKCAEDLKQRIDPKHTPVMMSCTGGIRCEVFSAFLKDRGFEKVYQLDGGVINYGLKEGSKHWKGKLFVFDDRMTVPISEEGNEVIGKCHHCQNPSEEYFNCANMDCNTLFLCCTDCLKGFIGCCSQECTTSEKLRPLEHQNPHKPFRKWYEYFSTKASCQSEGECMQD